MVMKVGRFSLHSSPRPGQGAAEADNGRCYNQKREPVTTQIATAVWKTDKKYWQKVSPSRVGISAHPVNAF